jgi:putative FmdB family regulatory protein
MPLYEYQCESCAKRFERIQKYSDPPIETCPSCGSHVKKLLSSPAIQFKGSGFYINDYAKKSQSDTAKSQSEGGKSQSEGGKSQTENAGTKSESSSAGSDSGSPAPSAPPATTSTSDTSTSSSKTKKD